jgi:hypothetical protein
MKPKLLPTTTGDKWKKICKYVFQLLEELTVLSIILYGYIKTRYFPLSIIFAIGLSSLTIYISVLILQGLVSPTLSKAIPKHLMTKELSQILSIIGYGVSLLVLMDVISNFIFEIVFRIMQ